MIKKRSVILFLFGISFSTLSFTGHYHGSSSIVPSSPQKPPALRTIVIDPGHGGIDPGTTNGLISVEKKVTLGIGLKLGEAIKKQFHDIKVVYTRTTDILPGHASSKDQGIHNRASIANQAKGDLFISIHCDATVKPAGGYTERRITGYKKRAVYVGKGRKRAKKMMSVPVYTSYWVKNTVKGATVYIWKADRSGKKGDAIDQRGMNPEDMEDSSVVWDTESPEARMRADLYEKKFFNNSAALATMIEEQFRKAGRKTWGVKQRGVGIGVLEATGMPSVLIETGFLSNKEEEAYLNSKRGQDEVVENIITAIKLYKRQLEGGK